MIPITYTVAISFILPIALGFYAFYDKEQSFVSNNFITYSLLVIGSCFAYKLVDKLIPLIKEITRKAGLSGKDINKKGTKEGEKDV